MAGRKAQSKNTILSLLFLQATVVLSHGLADASHWKRPASPPSVTGRDVDYVVGNTIYQGYLAVPRLGQARAGVLIAHQYMGLIDYEKARADEMAASGYVAFALDVYGKGVRCNTTECAQAAMGKALSDIPLLRTLISAGTKVLLQTWPDSTKLVAFGYCFGGSMVLELARHPTKGASQAVTFKAVSSIHGTLGAYSNEVAAKGEVVARVQAHHAELDFQGDAGLAGFEAEFKVGVDGSFGLWETIKYAKCSHGWTEPGTPVYQARAAVQAHKSTFAFFEMALGFDNPDANPFPPLPICQKPGQSPDAALVAV